jgi:D-alanyl-lipoteichoic acid acyltransferase DltB (MBOAT superfamily)
MPTQLTLNQLLIFGAIIGVIFGLIVLFFAYKKNKLKLGVIGFLLTSVAGTFFSMLGALPVFGVFLWLILRNPSTLTPTEETAQDITENIEK